LRCFQPFLAWINDNATFNVATDAVSEGGGKGQYLIQLITKHLEQFPCKWSAIRGMISAMRTADFDFSLPNDLIAQNPAPERDQSRLLILHRDAKSLEHSKFCALLEYLRKGDVLVLNDSRVIPARLRGVNAETRGEFEMLLLEERGVNDWWTMLRPGKRAKLGTRILILDGARKTTGIEASVTETNEEGHRRLRFSGSPNILENLPDLGEMPVPPYISRSDAGRTDEDRERYQTVYARPAGSVAAPTAGLHFTQRLLDKIRSQGVKVCFVTLHVGLGTFAPVKTETVAAHKMHCERYYLSESTARTITKAKNDGSRIIAAGTTTVRVLESIALQNGGQVCAEEGKTRIFIYPPYDFKVVDSLLTNFHLPRSTLLMLVSAFANPGDICGREMILAAYAEAIRRRYRFFSYGDAMLIL
jgi:S-adenosylmethionine:tRNA ribosyltransferase-isomerase